MKKNIHPPYSKLQVQCSGCKGLNIVTASTLQQETFYTEKCLHCHPAFTKGPNKNHTVTRTKQRTGKVFSLSQLAK